MIRALYTSASGMQSQQTNLDVISNNLANVNTTGFKKNKIEFQDLLYQTEQAAGAEQGNNTQLATGVEVGHGSRIAGTGRIFTAGDLSKTGEDLDVAIDGEGFFEVQLPDGTSAYTRDGAFKMNANGEFVNNQGLKYVGFGAVPAGTKEISVAPGGTVTMTAADGTRSTFEIQLTRFMNPSGLKSVGGNLFTETGASGTPEVGQPNSNGFGSLQQGYLELSNVKVVEEMVNMIVAQRAYEVNSKSVKAADEMLQIAGNLTR
jgi:flagellar basal-body rod protein FlgG